ncbi:hypodermin-B-like [Drosophila rhopaloa]|uniref:Peptidase S1 domain-containing protein n=2 Tax=Drosophila rhopaloa TaxID=1041015 RepID=A0ABM5I8J9_DRORH|nr:hypodermin-B-like [Drosophila rhopaloa]
MILPVALPLFLGLCVLVLSEDSEDSEMEVDKCDNTTIGGEPMDIKDAPWTASITVREKAKCVGVIYKLNYILTVAQCVDGYLNKAIRVRVGSTTRSDGVTEATICDTIIHEKFNLQATNYNVALLKLCSPLKDSATIKPIQLVDKFPADGSKVLVTGWPSFRWWTEYFDQCLEDLAHKLQKAEVKMSGKKKCMKDWPEKYQLGRNLTDEMFCTEKTAKNSCSFDLGAPLAFKEKLVGILVRGGCSARPEIYNNLQLYRSWLDKNTK